MSFQDNKTLEDQARWYYEDSFHTLKAEWTNAQSRARAGDLEEAVLYLIDSMEIEYESEIRFEYQNGTGFPGPIYDALYEMVEAGLD